MSEKEMTDWAWTVADEPHGARRKVIMQTHPEVKAFMHPEWRSKYIALSLVCLQVVLSVVVPTFDAWSYVFLVYFVGATLTQALFLAIHELSHNLFFKATQTNRLFAMVCNFPIVFPFSESFRFYHLAHHKQQGAEADTDIASSFEARVFKGKLGKFVWFNFQILAYALRPVLLKSQPITPHLQLNALVQLIFNIVMYRTFGYGPFVYFILCTLVAGGMGFHPTSGHFITEHYQLSTASNHTKGLKDSKDFKDSKHFKRSNNETKSDIIHETFDNYGVLNMVMWNVGYHNAHHDFPNVPWSMLPKLTRIAQYKDTEPVSPSWFFVPFLFVFDDRVSLYSRVKRKELSQ